MKKTKFEYLRADYNLQTLVGITEEDRYVNEYSIKLYGVYDDGSLIEKPIFIGEAKVELFLLGLACEHNYSFEYIFDTSQARRDFFNGIYNFEKNRFVKKVRDMLQREYNPNLLNIDRIEILPKFRGMGHGKKIIKEIILRFNSSFGLAVLKAFPLQLEVKIGRDEWREQMNYRDMEQNPRKAKSSLYEFYRSIGFENVLKNEYFFLHANDLDSWFYDIDDESELITNSHYCSKG